MQQVGDDSGNLKIHFYPEFSSYSQQLLILETSMRALIFLGRVANELSSSPCLPNISSGTDAGHGQYSHGNAPLRSLMLSISDFRARMRGLHELVLDRWRRYSVRTVTVKYHESCLAVNKAIRSPTGTYISEFFSLDFLSSTQFCSLQYPHHRHQQPHRHLLSKP